MGDVRVTEQDEQIEQTGILRPGDTLIVRVGQNSPMEAAKRVGEQIRESLPGVKVLVVGAEEMVIYRPEGDS